MKNWLLASLFTLATSLATASEAPSLREALLHDYFEEASVCATADIVSIKDDETVITIDLQIETITSKGLTQLVPQSRDDWFSLHCPPESHAVWRLEPGLVDIRVRGTLADNSLHLLSCVQYQVQLYQRMGSSRKKANERLDALLGR